MENSKLKFLESKNVFVFDTETTGLPEKVPYAKWGSPNEYWPYKMNNKYSNSRIVSIAWVSIPNYITGNILQSNNNNNNNNHNDNDNNIEHFIRYPEGFDTIPTEAIHGITWAKACNEGLKFIDIFDNKGLKKALMDAEYIIAHNVFFDVHILMNELWRLQCDSGMECIKHIETMIKNGKCICSGVIGRDICKIEYKTNKKARYDKCTDTENTATKKYKIPKLVELYKFLYGCEFQGQHRADCDVIALLQCLNKM